MSAEKRIEFRKKLEESGLFDSITCVISQLYEEYENPIDPLQFLKERLGNSTGANPDELRAKNTKLREEIQQLEQRIAEVKKQKGNQ
ncbi:hypothetical protein TRFO_23996 [Tritrichomonas foetus]|uniref:c-Myc-binding protein n=1 Tax=Tritrichomonas foetus TaxID=1144522 RepID=A0A1J4K896_9EUKA|nr:hypothetical protein TRFO_23996 [Tritrichomonas foetus]|eukprot:OHT07721.1 hypothetical protein TRFO_23996 [Tritrichomonas foetus]